MTQIIPNLPTTQGSCSETELVQREKQEYKLLGSYLRTRGLRIYGYNSIRNKLYEVEIICGNTIHLIPDGLGNLIPIDPETEKSTVDARDIHFEALNWKNAQHRVNRYKQGKLKELCNLREAGSTISFF